jgi:predicted Zn finger-like uncharacterized protein
MSYSSMKITCPSCDTSYAVDGAAFGDRSRTVRCSACGASWEVSAPAVEPAEPPPVAAPSPAEEPAVEPASEAATPSPPPEEVTDVPPSQPVETPPPSLFDRSDASPSTLEPFDSSDTGPSSPPSPSDTELADLDFAADADDVERQAGPERTGPDDEIEEPVDEPAVDEAEERPPSRWSRALPIAAAVGVVGVVSVLALARDSIVQAVPAMSGVYAVFGLGGEEVAGAGLEFRDVASSRAWSGAEEVLLIHGKITNVAKDPVPLPPVRVALYDVDDTEVQAVSVPHGKGTLAPGETVPFEARILNPVLSAQRIRVRFGAGAERSATGAS